jgi:hypothetical protein
MRITRKNLEYKGKELTNEGALGIRVVIITKVLTTQFIVKKKLNSMTASFL